MSLHDCHYVADFHPLSLWSLTGYYKCRCAPWWLCATLVGVSSRCITIMLTKLWGVRGLLV